MRASADAVHLASTKGIIIPFNTPITSSNGLCPPMHCFRAKVDYGGRCPPFALGLRSQLIRHSFFTNLQFVLLMQDIAGQHGQMETLTVYLLRCSDGTTYTGCTEDIEVRIQRHLDGHIQHTRTRLPIQILVTVSFNDRLKAFQFEKYLKSGSGRAFAKRHFN